jgi:phosphopantetheinyl transferase
LYKSTKLLSILHKNIPALHYQIKDIIHNNELTIKFLRYEPFTLREIDLGILTEKERIKISHFKSSKRKLEFFFTRLLWSSFGLNETINYNNLGKPIITSGYLSISHSQNVIAIGFSKTRIIGIDIEHYNEKIFHIREKFLSKVELDRFDMSNMDQLTTLWSIKEALYKFRSEDGLSFKEDIEILQLDEINLAQIKKGYEIHTIPFERICFNEFILTYCIKYI